MCVVVHGRRRRGKPDRRNQVSSSANQRCLFCYGCQVYAMGRLWLELGSLCKMRLSLTQCGRKPNDDTIFSISCCIQLHEPARIAYGCGLKLSKNEGVPDRTPCGECREPLRRAGTFLCPT